MNTQQAAKEADFIEHAKAGTDKFHKLLKCVENKSKYKYYDPESNRSVRSCRIIHASNGSDRNINFYLKLVKSS